MAYKGLVLFENSNRTRLEQDRADLITQDWDEEGDPAYYALCAKRPGIGSAYSNIPLKIMAEYARKPDVKLNIDTKLDWFTIENTPKHCPVYIIQDSFFAHGKAGDIVHQLRRPGLG